jgi:hypothetical protein
MTQFQNSRRLQLMTTMYVLADRGESELSSPVFSAGTEGREEAAVVFTSRVAAEQYIAASGWEDSEVPAELQPIPLLRWLLNLDAEGVEYVAVDPDRGSHRQGVGQTMLSVHELVADVSERLCTRLQVTTG